MVKFPSETYTLWKWDASYGTVNPLREALTTWIMDGVRKHAYSLLQREALTINFNE